MVDDNKLKYFLITPAKNEEKNFSKVAESVLRQTILPVLWVIVDDGSTDTTPTMIRTLENEYDWIESIRLPQHPRDITFHVSSVYKTGFDKAMEFCDNNNIPYNYIGSLDADTVLEHNYFQTLFREFEKDELLGIASGRIVDTVSDDIVWDNIRRDNITRKLPRGSGRLWRKTCFIEIGGIPNEPSWDAINNVKALLRGWKIAQFGHVIAIQQRQTSSAEGLWRGYRINGEMAHYLHKHPLLVLLGSLFYTAKKPYYHGIAYLYGYILRWTRNAEIIQDSEVRDYYWHDRLREYVSQITIFK